MISKIIAMNKNNAGKLNANSVLPSFRMVSEAVLMLQNMLTNAENNISGKTKSLKRIETLHKLEIQIYSAKAYVCGDYPCADKAFPVC